jgi:hypothetical protein
VKIAGEHRSLEGKREIKGSKHASDELSCRGTFVSNNFCFDTTALFFAKQRQHIVVYPTEIGHAGPSTSGGGGVPSSGETRPPSA